MEKDRKALETFSTGLSCAQSVLLSFAEELGVEEEKALKLASGFGGGIGRMAGTCGAVTGAIMVIGLMYGYTTGEDKAAKDTTYSLVRQFAAEFARQNGSTVCRELLGCDVSTSQGFRDATDSGVFKTLCPRYVESAVLILEKMLES